MREDIVSFVMDDVEEPPFFIEMTGISYCDETYRIARKNSLIYVFEYILEGEGTIITDEMKFTAKKGDIYILHRQSNHEYYSNRANPWTKIWFNARGPLIDGLMQLYGLNHINHIPDTDASSYLFRILSCAKETHNTRAEFIEAASMIFYELILFLHKSVHKDNHPLYSSEAMTLKQYLDMNNRNNVTLKELSMQIYHSPSQTIRIFKKSFGITPYQYLMNQKLELAKLILMNTNKSIKEISIDLNFRDEHYFSNYFKKKIGVSPRYFRKNHK